MQSDPGIESVVQQGQQVLAQLPIPTGPPMAAIAAAVNQATRAEWNRVLPPVPQEDDLSGPLKWG
jgi:hypothetical protein